MPSTPSQRTLFSQRGLAVATLVLTFVSSVTLLVLRPARVAPTPGIGAMKVNDAIVVLREKSRLIDNPLCHLLIISYRCSPERRLLDLDNHIATMATYGRKVPDFLSSQTRELVERTDQGIGHVLDEERVGVGKLLFAMITLGGAGALALWFGLRRRAFSALGMGTVTPLLLGVEEPTALVFSGYLGAIAILSIFVPGRPPAVAARLARDPMPRVPDNMMPRI
jgi:hypothetical protein